MLVINQLTKFYGSQIVLNGIDLKIQQGEIIGILGPSGSGKSTFLRCINHLEVPSGGSIVLDGHALSDTKSKSHRSRIGMVFQGFNLFSNMTVLENLTYAPVHVGSVSQSEAIEKASLLLKRVGLEKKASAFPHTLSGGEKQRAAIARTLMMDPEVILLDEPTSALDPGMVQEVVQVIRSLANTGITLLIVTHEMTFVREVVDRVVYLEKGQISHDVSPDVFFQSRKHLLLH